MYKLVIIILCVLLTAYAVKSGYELIGIHELETAWNEAMRGNVDSQLRLSQLYKHGKFVEINKELSGYWYAVLQQSGKTIRFE